MTVMTARSSSGPDRTAVDDLLWTEPWLPKNATCITPFVLSGGEGLGDAGRLPSWLTDLEYPCVDATTPLHVQATLAVGPLAIAKRVTVLCTSAVLALTPLPVVRWTTLGESGQITGDGQAGSALLAATPTAHDVMARLTAAGVLLGLSARDMQRATGISPRTWQSWKEKPDTVPRRSSARRLWEFIDVVEELNSELGTDAAPWLLRAAPRVHLLEGRFDQVLSLAVDEAVRRGNYADPSPYSDLRDGVAGYEVPDPDDE
jgi:uncharacterized protein (DUF2384 family)